MSVDSSNVKCLKYSVMIFYYCQKSNLTKTHYILYAATDCDSHLNCLSIILWWIDQYHVYMWIRECLEWSHQHILYWFINLTLQKLHIYEVVRWNLLWPKKKSAIKVLLQYDARSSGPTWKNFTNFAGKIKKETFPKFDRFIDYILL